MSKRLPKGTWFDSEAKRPCRVCYYDSKSRMYRVEWAGPRGWWLAYRLWCPVEDFKPPRFQPPTVWSAVSDGVDIGP